MNPYIFREYDIRGLVSNDLTPENVKQIALGLGSYFKSNSVTTVSVGADIRLSSPELKKIMTETIAACGLNVIDIGHCTTGAQYFSQYKLEVQGGVMITGSHNPPDYNGFKITLKKKPVFGSMIQEIKTLIDNHQFVTGSGQISYYPILADYISDLRSKFKINSKVRVVIDSGNGAAALVAKDVFNNIEGLTVHHLFDEADGRFPNHHPDPTVEKNLVDLKRVIADTQADFGIGFDGDADRIGVVDGNGQTIFGDKLLIIYAKDALKKSKQDIIFDVKCSDALIEEIKKAGGNPIMNATGHSLLKNKLKETGASIAGEMSGHMFFADENYGYDCAIYAAVRLISIVSSSGMSIEAFLKDVTPYVSTPELRMETHNDEEKFKITQKAIEFFTKHYDCITVDGVRIKFQNGWGLVRSSNTQPVIVVRVEAKTVAQLDEYKSIIFNKLKEFGEVWEGGH